MGQQRDTSDLSEVDVGYGPPLGVVRPRTAFIRQIKFEGVRIVTTIRLRNAHSRIAGRNSVVRSRLLRQAEFQLWGK